ncbi:MFS transporter [Candidatus Saccharibacteria bacterium]|nr:MFS transporter [Candidatus Saccharibacteria bacterium]
MNTFKSLLYNTLLASATNNFLWFALTFWAYLETKSVLATAIIGGSFMLFSALLGMYFGTYVDRHKKKTAMLASSWTTLISFALATVVYFTTPNGQLLNIGNIYFWLLVILILFGAVAGNLRAIALSTSVTLLTPEKEHDRANGMVATVNGVSFTLTSVFSGLAVGQLGMDWVMIISLVLTLLATLRLAAIKVDEKQPTHEMNAMPQVDIRGAIKAIALVSGLMGLIFFTTFNNLLSGVFMALMDPYGLELVSVEIWGILWGVVSLGYIAGGILVAKKGLGKSPLKALFIANIIMWTISILFPLKSSVILLGVSMLIFMALMPFIEASEQTIIQKVVPFKKQGRVFGFAQSIESAASPITSFLIGPIAQFWAIPYMSENGEGAAAIGSWFGVGPERGMALLFIMAAIIGLTVTVLAMFSRSYRLLSRYYKEGSAQA